MAGGNSGSVICDTEDVVPVTKVLFDADRADLPVGFDGLNRDFAFKKKLPILPIVYEAKRGIKIRNKNYSFLCINNQKGHLFVYNYVTNKTYTYERRCP